MLSHLRVENFAVVEKVEVDFSPRLNVFTGETGAGKSILIDAISLFLKKTPGGSAIRAGKDKILVEALFTHRDEEWVLRREVGKRKSLCYINGGMVPFTTLRDEAEKLLNIYGQNEHVFLLNPANHRLFLDRFSKTGDRLEEMADVADRLRDALSRVRELRSQQAQKSDRMDLIEFQISEIDKLEMEEGDEERLEQRIKILSSSEDILLRSQQVIQDLYQGETSLYAVLADRLKDLEYLKEIYPDLADSHADVDKFYQILPDISASLSSKAEAVEYDENELNSIQERLHALSRLKTKHGETLEGLLEKRTALKEEKNSLVNMDFSIREINEEIDGLLQRYKELNQGIRDSRRKHAEELSALVMHELAQLEMKRAEFVVHCEEVEPTLENISDRGTDRLEFYFSSNPGQKPGKIKDVVSGGELSRLMLVLKSIVQDEGSSTYIFDEIDAGIGGKTAQFVGEKLKRISRAHQVICISHLPQIVSFADKHFLIDKEVRDNQTYSSTTALGEEGSIKEIARLMAGRDVDRNVLEAAKNLLAAARKRG